MNNEVFFIKLDERATIPTYGHDDSTNAGVDLYSCEGVCIPAGGSISVRTGVAWDPSNIVLDDPNYKVCMVINSRSGMAFKDNIESSNAGIIDQTYTGEIKVLLRNLSRYTYTVEIGDRIAQGLIFIMPVLKVTELHKVPETTRGNKGFGSSGK